MFVPIKLNYFSRVDTHFVFSYILRGYKFHPCSCISFAHRALPTAFPCSPRKPKPSRHSPNTENHSKLLSLPFPHNRRHANSERGSSPLSLHLPKKASRKNTHSVEAHTRSSFAVATHTHIQTCRISETRRNIFLARITCTLTAHTLHARIMYNFRN